MFVDMSHAKLIGRGIGTVHTLNPIRVWGMADICNQQKKTRREEGGNGDNSGHFILHQNYEVGGCSKSSCEIVEFVEKGEIDV